MDRNVTSLESEDRRFRESLRHITEVDNLETKERIEELKREKEELRASMEGLIKQVEGTMQQQIDKLTEIDQV